MLLNLNQKTTVTAEKLILEKKKKSSTRKKNNYQLCKKRTCTATFVMEHSWTLFCTVKKFEHVVGTLIQYLHDGDIFNIRIQCSVLEVL